MITTLRYAAATHVGRVRSANEDSLVLPGAVVNGARFLLAEGEALVAPHPGDGSPDEIGGAGGGRPTGSAPPVVPIVAVVDGMGGHRAGQRASGLVARYLGEAAPISDVLTRSHDALYAEMRAHPEVTGMGATVAGVVCEPSAVTAFVVGDARVYQYDTGYLLPVGELHRAGNGRLTQSLGGTAEPVGIEPWAQPFPVTGPCRWLVCTDGLWDHVGLADIKSALSEAGRRAAAESLIAAALDAGAPDNVTLAVVDVDNARTSPERG